MNNLFDLKQSAAELPSLNQGLARQTYEQHPPTRDVTGAAFPKGAQHIRWQVAGTRWWIPSKSYIRMRCKISGLAGVLPKVSDDVAPNMNLMANLFQSAEFRIAEKTVSRVSDYMAQVDTLEKRITKSGAWLKTAGQSLDWFDPDQAKRVQAIASDGYDEAGVKFQPEPAGLTAAEMGFDIAGGPTTGAWNGGTNVFTLAAGGGDAPNILTTQILHVGDLLVGNAGNFNNNTYEVKKILTLNTFLAQDYNNVDTDVAAETLANITFIRVSDRACNDSYQRNELELIWQPPLSIFKVGHAMPAGKYELTLTPHNSVTYKKRAIESVAGDKASPADFDFEVTDMYLYLATVEGPAVDTMSYFISLEETRCQAESVKNNTALQQQNFDVSPSTFALTVAFQDVQAGVSTDFSAAKFKVRTVGDLGKYPSGELALSRFFIQYAGQNKPQPDADPIFASPAALNSQLYAESQLYSGAYFDCGGTEDKNEWIRRGPYYYYSWPRDGNSESTRANVNFSFETALGTNGRVLLFDHHKQMLLVSIVEGRVVDVVAQDG